MKMVEMLWTLMLSFVGALAGWVAGVFVYAGVLLLVGGDLNETGGIHIGALILGFSGLSLGIGIALRWRRKNDFIAVMGRLQRRLSRG